VHPTNPDVIYLRVDGWQSTSGGRSLANDALLFSDDGGQSFREVHRGAAKLFGFTLSPDGSEVLVGYGDPVEASRTVDPVALGIFRAAAADHLFSPIYDGAVSCLTWSPAGLYACTSQSERGYSLGFAENPNFDLSNPDPFTPLLDLRSVTGPLDCPSCTSGAVCRAAWPDSCAVFGNCDAGTTAGSAGGACIDGGSERAGEGGAGTEPRLGAGGRHASCACRGGGGRSDLHPLGVLLVAAFAASRRRGRSARQSLLGRARGDCLCLRS
jgi:hypothetical protein